LERAFLVEVRRSKKRRKTIEAYRKGDTIIVAIPARMSKREEERVVAEMVSKLSKDDLRLTSSELMSRALELNSLYLDGKATPITVEWSSRMERIWGSCTIEERAIRLSSRLDDAPRYALDFILLHELVHLIVPGHGSDFKALLGVYPELERAEGYLEGRQIRLDEDLIDSGEPAGMVINEGLAQKAAVKEELVEVFDQETVQLEETAMEFAQEVSERAEQVAPSTTGPSRGLQRSKSGSGGEGQLELIALNEISA
jgi:hypothetical protein